MGCDIHCFFEEKTSDGWVPLFGPYIPEHWYENLVEDMVQDGRAALLAGTTNCYSMAEAAERAFKEIAVEEAVVRFGDSPRFCWAWHIPNRRSIQFRGYSWFAALAGVRAYNEDECIWAPRGLPNDVSRPVEREYEAWGRDAHTPSWLSLDEIFRVEEKLLDMAPNDASYRIEWLNTFIPKPKQTRMVFWFDN